MRAITIGSSVIVVMLVGGLGAGAARADEVARADQADKASGVHVALGVNSPLGWSNGESRGASLYVGVGGHQAIRANAARYNFDNSKLGAVLSALAGGDGGDASYRGRTSDLGIGWVYYLDRPWHGWTFELGVLRRARDHRVDDDFADAEVVITRTTTYAGRAMVGWTWLMYDHVFLAVSAGLSVGREAGTEAAGHSEHDLAMRTTISREDVTGEGLLRLGVAFDL